MSMLPGCPCTRGPVVLHDGHCCFADVSVDGDDLPTCHPDVIAALIAASEVRP